MGYKKNIDEFATIDVEEMRKKDFLEKVNKRFKQHHLKINCGHGWKEIEKCPLCSSSEKEKEFSKFEVDIFKCKKCGLRYAGKIPQDSNDIYGNENYVEEMMESYKKNISYRKQRFGKERVNLIKLFTKKQNPKLLDVGCGIGWFLESAKEAGFEIYGQEVNKGLAEFVSQRLGIEIFNKSINDLKFEMKFDVITLFDVLEHIENPIEFLKQCKELLSEDGIILIFTPNFDSLTSYVMKENSNLICPSEHLIYFTEDSVKKLAEKVDMELVYYTTCGIDLGDLKSYYEYKRKDYLAKSCVELYSLIQPLVDASGAGNHMRFILKEKTI